jgi:hypothetical protein
VTAVPVVIRATRYRCPFCARSRAKKAAAVAHIARCWHSPEVRACKTCEHYEPPQNGPYPEHPGWPEDCGAGVATEGIVSGCPEYTTVVGD